MAIKWVRTLLEGDELFEFNLKCLLYVGLWPKKNWSKLQKLFYINYERTLLVLSFIYLIFTGIGTYQHRHDVTVFLSNLDKCLVAYNFVLKVIIFLRKRTQLRELIVKMANSGDTITEERKRLMTSLVMMVALISTGIVGAFCALAQYKGEMVVEAWMPFDPMKNKINLVVATQILSNTFLVPCLYRNIAMQGIVCSIIIYVCDQLVDVQNRLKNLKYNVENEPEMRAKFKKIIKKHVRLMSYSKELDSIFKEFFLVQNLQVTTQLCLNAINVAMVRLEDKILLVNFLAFLGITLLNAYIYCYLGNEMITQSQGVAVAAYETTWTSWPVDLQKDLMLVICVAQKPLKLTAGGMTAMSIQTYSQTLYNGYSIFAVLNDAVD